MAINKFRDINDSGVELIGTGDAFRMYKFDVEITKSLKQRLTGTVYEHLIKARELSAAEYKLFVVISSVQTLGNFNLRQPLFLGKIFADGITDYPQGCDILLARAEFKGDTPWWNADLVKLYNKVIKYKDFYFSQAVLDNLQTGRSISIDDYINGIALKSEDNAVTNWLS